MLISLLRDQNFGSRPIQDDFSSQSHYFISNFRDPKIPFSDGIRRNGEGVRVAPLQVLPHSSSSPVGAVTDGTIELRLGIVGFVFCQSQSIYLTRVSICRLSQTDVV